MAEKRSVRPIAALIAVALASVASTTDTPQPAAAEFHRAGLESLRAGHRAEAIHLLEQAAESEPHELRYRLALARAYRADSQEAKAREVLEGVLRDDPHHEAAALELADLHLDAGAPDNTVALLGPIAATTGNAAVLRLLADAHYQQKQLAQARACYLGAIRTDGGSADDRFKLGRVYLHEHKYALAVKQLTEAEELGATGGELHYLLAVANSQLGNHFGRVREIAAPGAAAGRIFGNVFLVEPLPGRPDRFLAAPAGSAIHHLQLALDAGFDTLEVRLTQAEIWLQARRYARAAELFSTLVAQLANADLTTAEKARAHFGYAQALYGADDLQGYLSHLKQAVALDGTQFQQALAVGYRQIASRYNQRGELARCLEFLELAVTEAPESADLRYRLGNGYWEAGQRRQAAHQWLAMLQLDPDHPDRTRVLELIQLIDAQGER